MDDDFIRQIRESYSEVNHNTDFVAPIREAIEDDDVQRLGIWVRWYGADLSRFAGDWDGDSSMTPIAYAILHRSENAFRYLLTVVDLGESELMRIDEEEHDLLTFTNSLTQGPNGQEYVPYINMLRDAGVGSDNLASYSESIRAYFGNIDKIWTRKFEHQNDEVVQQECNTSLRGIVPHLVEILNRGVPDAIRRENLIGKEILRLLEHGIDFDIDLFDLRRLFYDATTERIYERLRNDRSERNFTLASSRHNNKQSRLAALSLPVIRHLAELTLAENLRGLRLGECCVCFEKLDLHTVCPNMGENTHELCGKCRTNMQVKDQINCPICRTRMYGT
jgi:hypothetical protein